MTNNYSEPLVKRADMCPITMFPTRVNHTLQNALPCHVVFVLFRPFPEGGLLWFHHVLFLFFVQSFSFSPRKLLIANVKNASGRIGIFMC